MIASFRDPDARALTEGRRARRLPPDIQRRAQRKLMMLNSADDLNDLRAAPGNRLEALSGDRRRQHSIRINHQWRSCFVWIDGEAHGVEIVDYD